MRGTEGPRASAGGASSNARSCVHPDTPPSRPQVALYRHKTTGAEVMSMANTDENKVFSVVFRTTPSDSTGVPHILEHSVLCGSRKYPVKVPPAAALFFGEPPGPVPLPSGDSSGRAVGASLEYLKPKGGGGQQKQSNDPGNNQHNPQYADYWAPLTRKRHIPPHPAQPQHTNYWAPRTRKRHQQEHRPQRPTERSDPTQHAKGRAGDCPGPRKGATTRRNVTQGGRELGGLSGKDGP